MLISPLLAWTEIHQKTHQVQYTLRQIQLMRMMCLISTRNVPQLISQVITCAFYHSTDVSLCKGCAQSKYSMCTFYPLFQQTTCIWCWKWHSISVLYGVIKCIERYSELFPQLDMLLLLNSIGHCTSFFSLHMHKKLHSMMCIMQNLSSDVIVLALFLVVQTLLYQNDLIQRVFFVKFCDLFYKEAFGVSGISFVSKCSLFRMFLHVTGMAVRAVRAVLIMPVMYCVLFDCMKFVGC